MFGPGKRQNQGYLKTLVQILSSYDKLTKTQFSQFVVFDPLLQSRMTCINPLLSVKEAIGILRDAINQRKLNVQVILLERQFRMPMELCVQQDLFTVILQNLLSLSITTCQSKCLVIFISWQPPPSSTDFFIPIDERASLEPYFVVQSSESSISSLSSFDNRAAENQPVPQVEQREQRGDFQMLVESLAAEECKENPTSPASG